MKLAEQPEDKNWKRNKPMTLPYGFVKAKPASLPRLQSKQMNAHGAEELQYHLHLSLDVNGAMWDTAVNVGTDDASDLLKYKIVEGFKNPIAETMRGALGAVDLTGTQGLPALDFLRGGILDGTGAWSVSDVLTDGAAQKQPPARLAQLLGQAFQGKNDVYVFGRFYSEGNGIHDVHMNQGSRGRFIHRPGGDGNDHNDIWQDGALMIDFGAGGWVAYFSAFTGQTVPTDDLGNPLPGGNTI
jgi:uncharacterized protein YukJ